MRIFLKCFPYESSRPEGRHELEKLKVTAMPPAARKLNERSRTAATRNTDDGPLSGPFAAITGAIGCGGG